VPTSRRDRLRGELQRIRTVAGISGRDMGARLGITQATISRIERGETLPPIPIVRGWLDAAAKEQAERERLLDLAEAVHAETRGWAELLDNTGHTQQEALAAERAVARVRSFQPTVIPGLLQTPEYARAILAIGRTRDVAAALATRIERQQVLYEEGRQFHYLIAEPVLHWPVGGPAILAAQRDRLVSLMRLPTVHIGIIPTTTAVAAAWNNFILWEPTEGRPYVTTELIHGAQEIHDTDRIELYETLWKQLSDIALTGDDAASAIRP
jgi:Predicted transcriptional regulator with C-terminal CBS domains